MNLYGFASGDPVTYTDPFGLCKFSDGWTGCETGSAIAFWGHTAGASSSTLGSLGARVMQGLAILGEAAAQVPLTLGGGSHCGPNIDCGVVPLGIPGRATWPATAEAMDADLGIQGTRVADGPNTPGRGKVVWQPNSNTKIVFEQHPYDANAPDYHKGPHWHLDTPGKDHVRYVPGEPIP